MHLAGTHCPLSPGERQRVVGPELAGGLERQRAGKLKGNLNVFAEMAGEDLAQPRDGLVGRIALGHQPNAESVEALLLDLES